MKFVISNRAKKITWVLALIYFASYLLRKNFSVMLAAIVESGFDTVALGIVGSAMTVSYGVGQIINGVLSDKIKPEAMLTVGLVFSSVCNFAMYFCTTIPLMAVIWFFNGFAQSMLWPPIVRLMATYMNDIEYGYAAVRISCASSLATILLYILAPAFLAFLDWRGVIVCIGFVGLVITVLWVIFGTRIFKTDTIESDGFMNEKKLLTSDESKEKPLSLTVYLMTLPILIAIILQGALRDGVGDWMPTFMADAFKLDVGSAIATGVIPCAFSIVSFYLFDIFYRKFFRSEISCAGVIFASAAVVSAILLLINLLVPTGWIAVVISVILIAAIVVSIHGVNLMRVVMLPKQFAKSGRVSAFSGLLNSATYVGAAIALPVFPAIRNNFGWNATIGAWGIISIVGAVVCLASMILWKKSADKGE